MAESVESLLDLKFSLRIGKSISSVGETSVAFLIIEGRINQERVISTRLGLNSTAGRIPDYSLHK